MIQNQVLNTLVIIFQLIVMQKNRLVSIRKEDLDSLEATIETLQSQEIMKQLLESERDIRAGRTRNARKLLKELD